MRVAIIITTPDYAGVNIRHHLEAYPFTVQGSFQDKDILSLDRYGEEQHTINIYTTDTRCVDCERFDKLIDADIFLFPTTHRSAAGTHSLSCHVQGNWGPADLGGIPRNVSHAPARLLKAFFKELLKHAKDYEGEITLEATHHGPELEKPCLFLEIGSDDTQWRRPELGKLWAAIIMNVLSKKQPAWQTAVGIGGTHYCHNFNAIQATSNIALGHICPKYAMEHLDVEMLRQAVDKTVPKAELIILDWKGLGSEKNRVLSCIEELGIPWKRTRDIEK